MTSDVQQPNENPLVIHAQRELTLAGLFDEDADYGPGVGDAVLELVKVLASQGHSGGSHHVTMAAFNEVANFRTLTPVTNDPDEWMRVNPDEETVGIWQNRRQGSIFSNDGGKTYYDLDERMTGEEQPVHNSKEHTSA